MNRIHVAPPVALALLALLAGCTSQYCPRTFPQAAADAWLGSFNGGDVAGLVLTYSADAKLLPPDEPIIAGAEAIEAFWQGYGPGQARRVEVATVETMKVGDQLVPRGRLRGAVPGRGRAARSASSSSCGNRKTATG